MSELYTTSALVQDVRDRGAMQASFSTYSSDKIVQQMSNILISKVAPTIASLQQEYLVHPIDVAWQGDNLAYTIPDRAIGVKLRDICLLNGASDQWISIPLIDPANLKAQFNSLSTTPPIMSGFYLQDDKVILWFGQQNAVTTYTGVKFKYYRRPNQLVLPTQAAQITVLSPNTSQVTVSSVPTTWTPGVLVDIIKGTPSFTSRSDDNTVSAISGTVLTLATYPTDLAVGDWISLQGTSPIPQVPLEWHSWLVQLTLIRLMQGFGNQKVAIYQEEAKELLNDALKTALPRVDSSPRSLANQNLLIDY